MGVGTQLAVLPSDRSADVVAERGHEQAVFNTQLLLQL